MVIITNSGLVVVRKFYGDSQGCVGFSIPASEHSTITSWGKEDEVFSGLFIAHMSVYGNNH